MKLLIRLRTPYPRMATVLSQSMFLLSSIAEGAVSEWVKVPVYEAILDIVCRSSNRTFVGLPLCEWPAHLYFFVYIRTKRTNDGFLGGRDPDYMELNINFTMDVVKAGFMINRFPNFLKPYVRPCSTPCSSPC